MMTTANLLPLTTSTWDQTEVDALHRVIASGRFTMGPEVAAFEAAFAEHVGARHAVMVNSGSSANLLAIAALTLRSEQPLRRGDEVIVPAVGWSTTYAPIHQHGLNTVLVDADAETYNIDIEAARAAITAKTRAIVVPNILGNPAPLDELRALANERELALIEDNCESFGARLDGRQAGTFGDLGTFSLFYSHHISTMEGGVVVTDDAELHDLLVALRAHGWTRDLPPTHRLDAGAPDAFMAPFWFAVPGYNVRPTELAGAVGQVQLTKSESFVAQRRANAATFADLVTPKSPVRLQRETGESSWFGFGMIVQGGRRARDALAHRLQAAGVETRPIVSGNIARQPMMRHIQPRVAGTLTGADVIHDQGLFIGNHHEPLDGPLHEVARIIGATQRPEGQA